MTDDLSKIFNREAYSRAATGMEFELAPYKSDGTFDGEFR